MSRRSIPLILALFLASFLAAEFGAASVQDELEAANRHYEEHSYQPALEGYRKVLASEARNQDELGHSALRVGLCLERLQRWDEALRDLEALEKRFPGQIWAARIRALRGSINLSMPHYYYEKGEDRSRTSWIQGATYHYTYYDDLIAALDHLSAAWELWQPHRPAAGGSLAPADLERRCDEIGRLGFDLAAALEAHRQQKGGLIGFEPHPDVLRDLKEKVPALATAEKMDPQTWFAQVASVSLAAGSREQAAMAGYLEAMYCQRLLADQGETRIVHERGETIVSCRVDQGGEKPAFVRLPDRSNPFRLLTALIGSYPETTVIDVASYVLARLQDGAQLHEQALATLAGFEDRFPKSRWQSDVKNLRQEILFPRLTCENPAPLRPGEKLELAVRVRNIEQLQVEARRFDLTRVMSSSRYLRDDELDLDQLERIIEKIVAPERRAAVSRTEKTPDEGKHLYHEMKLQLDLPEKGAWLVELRGGATSYRVLALVSDIAIVRKTGDEDTTVFVADATTGAPVSDAEVTVRQKHRARGLFGRYDKMTWDSGKTGSDGLFIRPHEDSSGNSIYIEAFARRGEDYAVTAQSWSPSKSSEAENALVYGFTDRPVYRPGETIGWVANLRTRLGEDYRNLPKEDFQVTVVDPKGNKIFDRSLETDDFGTIAASISVGAEPPLGTYNIQYRRGRRYVGGHAFRIEEYKKPEFEVLVAGPDEPVRVGDAVTLKIRGLYYFGATVDGARVAWRIYRDPYSPVFNLREPYSWLYGRRQGREYRARGGRELVAQGEGTTDERGTLEVALATAEWRERYPDEDHRFIVEADVTDLSRRTISGSGTVVVPRRGLFAHVAANRGFYRAGETAGFDIRVQTPQGSPAASEGQVTVFRVTARRDGEKLVEERTQVASSPAATARNGLGRFEWQTDTPGRFVVQYVTQDRWAEPVVGEQLIWVTDPAYRADDFQFKNIELLTDRDEYTPGDQAFVMLNSVFPDSHVLVTVEAGPKILSRRLLRTTGKTTVMSLDIPEGFAPNVFIHAVSVHDGGFYEASRELFVPPTHRFIDVGLKFDKPSYRPGEMATLELEARDHAGNPLDARFALRVMDRAITYIQDDDTADIRRFFHGNRRGFLGGDAWNSNTRSSQQYRFAGYLAASPEWIDHDGHGMPPGFWLDLELTQRLYGGGWGADSQPDQGELNRKGRRRFFDDGFLAAGDEAPAEESLDFDEEKERSDDGGSAKKLGHRLLETAAAPGAPAASAASGGIAGQPNEKMAAAELRGNFSDLATWQPELRTGADGRASVQFKFPDSLTDWEATARGITADTKVGMAETSVRTVKNVLVRLQAPRFFTETDVIVLSTLCRNDFDEAIDAEVGLEIEGGTIELDEAAIRKVRLEPGRELRVDWPARVVRSGEVALTARLLSPRESDAMRMSFPVHVYGITKTQTRSLVLEGEDGRASFPLVVPAERKVNDSRLELTLNPSLAATLMESLPYLIEYPYGCTEQTMSRFMPAVVVARTLADMGTSLDEIRDRRKDLDNRELLNARDLAPVYSDADLNGMLAAGLRRLESMQNSDGGFGWWRLDRSSVHLTSYVLQGLAEARLAGREVPEVMIRRAADWLEGELKDLEDLHSKAYAAFALARAGRKPGAVLDEVMKKRDGLATQGKAQLAIALEAVGRHEQAALILRNLEDFVRRDEGQGIAWWEGGSSWWRWYDDPVETNAWVLLAMTEISPDHRLSRPLSRWLIYNRTGNRWKSTRDTALSVLALARHAKAAGELDPDYEIVVRWGDRVLKRQKIDAANMFAFDNRIVLEGDAIATGPLPLVVERVGRGPLYVNCRLSYFSREDRITAAGDQIELRREYYLLDPIEKEVERDGRKVKVLDHERQKLDHLARIQAGDEIEVKLFVTASNDYEYIVLEDRKPAGFEPLELRSGSRYGNGVCSNMELRDEKVVFFVTWLQRGTHEISYRMRAEVPGTINAMPGRAEAMYAPKLGGISDSWRVVVTDDTN